jgi:hypothetical protein
MNPGACILDAFGQVRDASTGISLSNNSRKSPSQATQISGHTSINDFTNFPLITYWLTTYCSVGQKLSIAIARRQQGVYQSLHMNFVQ